MTGDGVNDTLALKDAEIGIAMGSGSAAARSVARFVILDNSFAVFPSVVAEGRRVIANVERVANLFLTKTFYAMLLSVLARHEQALAKIVPPISVPDLLIFLLEVERGLSGGRKDQVHALLIILIE